MMNHSGVQGSTLAKYEIFYLFTCTMKQRALISDIIVHNFCSKQPVRGEDINRSS
jgi:hypothetical protein